MSFLNLLYNILEIHFFSIPKFTVLKYLYTDQNPVPATVAGVVVSIFFVIGIVLTVVAAILGQRRCAGGRTKQPQDSFGICKLYDQAE